MTVDEEEKKEDLDKQGGGASGKEQMKGEIQIDELYLADLDEHDYAISTDDVSAPEDN